MQPFLFLPAILALTFALGPQTVGGGRTVHIDPISLGGPLVVGGIEVPQDEIKRFLIYGPGRVELEYQRARALIELGIELRIREEHVSREDFEVSEEGFRAALEAEAAKFERVNPTLDLETEIRRAYRCRAWYEREKRQEMQFDLVFIDDNPAEWPPVTFEALSNEPGDSLVDVLQQSWDRRSAELKERLAAWQARVDAGDPAAGPEPRIRPEDPIFRSMLRMIVRDWFCRGAETVTATVGLSSDLLCKMDFNRTGGRELVLTTSEVWKRIESTVTPAEVWEARKFLALIEATRQRLKREGNLQNKTQALARWEEGVTLRECHPYRLVAPTVAKFMFPSEEALAVYLQLFESYRDLVQPMLVAGPDGRLPEVLQAHLEHVNQVLGMARIDAEVLLVSSFDFPNFRWKEDGWGKASRKAACLAAALEEFPEAWSELLHAHCDFWDHSQPGWSRGSQNTLYKNGGEFGCITQDFLRRLLDESEYSSFLDHGLLTDRIFFDQPLEIIVGPYEGPWGYYLAKVLKRYPPRAPLDLQDEGNRRELRENWLRTSFIDYAHEALRQAK